MGGGGGGWVRDQKPGSHVTTCHHTSRYVTSLDVVSRYVTSLRFISLYVTSSTSFHFTSPHSPSLRPTLLHFALLAFTCRFFFFAVLSPCSRKHDLQAAVVQYWGGPRPCSSNRQLAVLQRPVRSVGIPRSREPWQTRGAAVKQQYRRCAGQRSPHVEHAQCAERDQQRLGSQAQLWRGVQANGATAGFFDS